MNLRNFFSFSYWVTQPKSMSGATFWVEVVFLLLLAAVGFVALFYVSIFKSVTQTTLWQKISSLSLTMGISGLVLFFFREQNVVLLGWRIWFLFWGITLIFWASKVSIYAFRRVPEIQKEAVERERRQKYLPKGQK